MTATFLARPNLRLVLNSAAYEVVSLGVIVVLAGAGLVLVDAAQIDRELFFTFGGLWAFGGTLLVAGTCIPWLLGPARVTYRIGAGELIVKRGNKLIARFPCESIRSVKVDGAFTWRDLVGGASPASFPRLVVWSDGMRHDMPAILCWGESTAAALEADMRSVLDQCRAERSSG